MNKADLECALACAALLEDKYTTGGRVIFEMQAANFLRLLCDEVGALQDEIAVAVAMEREACAKVCECMPYRAASAGKAATAIRARGQA